MRKALLLTMLILPVAFLSGCGRSNDSPKVTTSTNGDGTQAVTVTDDKGTKITVSGPGAGVSMPDYAPKFPGATVQSTITTPDKGGMVALKTTETPEAVIAFYKKAAQAAGFKDVLNMSSGDTVSYSAANDANKHGLNVVAVKGTDGTTVQVTWN